MTAASDKDFAELVLERTRAGTLEWQLWEPNTQFAAPLPTGQLLTLWKQPTEEDKAHSEGTNICLTLRNERGSAALTIESKRRDTPEAVAQVVEELWELVSEGPDDEKRRAMEVLKQLAV